MAITTRSPALGKRAGLGNTSVHQGIDGSEIAPKAAGTQAENIPAHVIEARRELLRDFAHEAATQAADHAELLARYIAMDDLPGLKYSRAKFVALAREAAIASRELISGGGR